MEENFISNGSVFRGILRLPVRGAALAANRWSNRKSGGILDRRIAAANLDRAGKLVVYTAVFGGRDKLIEAPKFPNVEYVCFTDDQTLASRTWRIVQVPPQCDPRLAAKVYKILPHRFFPDYEQSLWVDGTHAPAVDPRYLVLQYLNASDIALFAHPRRNCIYDEMDACLLYGKGDAERIRHQGEIYRREGYPAHNGLATCTVILRRHHSPQVRRTMEDWWTEIQRHSIRDQLSFNYAAHRHKLSYTAIPGDVYRNHLFHVEEHSRPDRNTLSVGWILNGSAETASARFMGYNMHEQFVSMGVRSKILFRPERRYAASINLEVDQIDEILRHNINVLAIVKLDSGRALNYLILRCRQLGVKLVYAACDVPLCAKLIEKADGILAPSREFLHAIPEPYRRKLFVVFDGFEHDASIRKTHHADRKLKLCLITNRVWNRLPCLTSLPEGVSLKIIGPSQEMLKTLFPRSKVFRDSPFDFEYVEWNPETVLREVLECDAGLIPWPRIDREVRVKSANRLLLFMSLAMPVVASPVPSFLEIVSSGVNSFIARSGSEWRECIELLRDDPALRSSIGKNARADVVPRFSKANQASVYLDAFKEVARL